ncbi:hypothetical protein FEM48_Zijuj05G0128600 [Ziziphus jujuba var. spinosa]|uniref:Xyloglucan endotransglucosylase/hydrolase n=1 Tax=Ziziphus jujuba var. spinosa TaxID=714518 RepID=A0A978VEX8_ZIZJJ|nr:hypothetical protein FEM48_Zijuj05G0128600 [Ziziphus jujuba var. spinosa]
MVTVFAGNFYQDFDITWGVGRGKILNNGQLLTLTLDKASGSGFQSKNQYLFGKIDMQIKLVPGNSAGTVTAYYLRSEGSSWDELDFEFLGNLSGDPYIVHTNVYTQGKGDRDFYVDGTPLREFKNVESIGVKYPKNQPMKIYSSLWNADDWARRGGLIKTDWSKAPFTVSCRNFNGDQACIWSSRSSSCNSKSKSNGASFLLSQELDSSSQQRLQWVQKNYMIYNYRTDTKRFPQGRSPECTVGKKSWIV